MKALTTDAATRISTARVSECQRQKRSGRGTGFSLPSAVQVADLTISDAEKVAPRATYKMVGNGLPPVGIPYVVVSGKVVVKDSVVQDVNAGEPIRFPVEEKGRFEPVTVNGWMGEHTINVPAIPKVDTTDAPEPLDKADK